MLRLVHATRCACFPWRLGWMHNVPVQAATCRECGLDIAQPVQQARDTPICIYCAIDDGSITEDEPITADPALMIAKTYTRQRHAWSPIIRFTRPNNA